MRGGGHAGADDGEGAGGTVPKGAEAEEEDKDGERGVVTAEMLRGHGVFGGHGVVGELAGEVSLEGGFGHGGDVAEEVQLLYYWILEKSFLNITTTATILLK